jgi:PAS domain S-box-containing protein
MRPGTVGAYALAVLSALAATAVRVAIDPYVVGIQYITFFPAIMITSLVSGFRAGFLCGLLSFAAAALFVAPFYPLDLSLFFLVMLSLALLTAGMRLAVEGYRELSLNLEQRVEERTREVVERSRELAETNRQLHEANDRFRAIYDRGGIFAAHLNLEGIIVDANPACVEGLGFRRADIIGKPFWEGGWWRVSPEVEEWIRKRVGQALAGEPSRRESNYVTGYREERVADVAMMPIRDDAGRVVSVSVNGMDITERARQYQAIFENAAVGIAHVSSDLGWIRANLALRRILGWPMDEFLTKSWRDISHPDDFAVDLAYAEQMRAGKIETYAMDKRHLRKDGTIVWARLTVSCVRRSDGSIDYFVAVVEDISARKRAEDALRDSEERLRAIYDGTYQYIGLLSRDGTLLEANRAALEWGGDAFDIKREHVIGCPFWETVWFVHTPGAPEKVREAVTRAAAGEFIRYETPLVRPSGEEVIFDISLHPIRNKQGDVSLIVPEGCIITDRKRAEEELAKSEERFRTSILHAPMPVFVCDDRDQILIINQAWLQQSRYSRDELRTLEDWTVRVHGERSPEVLAYLRELIAAEPEVRQIELPIRTGHGVIRYWNFVDYALGALSDGRRLFISIAQDTTDRRAYEERIELLMRESHHRIKNILGLVQAVARQTAARDPEHFVESFTERIQALAANHDLLVDSKWRGADVEDLVRVQLAHFADLVGSRIAVHGPKLRLNAAAAQAIGLAVHELATNASKYGALSTDNGRVDVDWRTEARSFAISWTERGGPPVQPPDRRGFGSTVIEAMAKRTLGGEVEADYAPSGFGWHLTCPAANALEATADTHKS